MLSLLFFACRGRLVKDMNEDVDEDGDGEMEDEGKGEENSGGNWHINSKCER